MGTTIITSKLRLTYIIPLGIFVFLSVFILFITNEIFNAHDLPSILPYLAVAPFFVVIWLWLILGELKKNINRVILTEDLIIVSKFGGLSEGLSYPYGFFDSLTTSILTSRSGKYEYLYLIKGEKRLVTLSQFYHLNYQELKDFLLKKINASPTTPYNISNDFNDLKE